MATEHRTRRSVKATETSFAILEHLKEVDGACLTEVADHLSLANSTVHKHLQTLTDLGYLVREGDEYHASLEFLNIGGLTRERFGAPDLVEPAVEELAEITGEQTQFIAEQNGRGYHVCAESGERATQIDTRLGKRIYLHANSSGKAILAHLPEERVEAILDEWGLPEVTENTITDREELYDRLEVVRERGYAYNLEEHVVGYCGAAAPVQRADGTVLGAIALGGPTRRLEGEPLQEELPEVLLEIANELELRIEFS